MIVDNPTAGIILAAGRSRRMGYPKQLVQIKGRPLVEIAVTAALGSYLDRIILVLGQSHGDIIGHLNGITDGRRLKVVINHRYREGLSRSVHTGLSEVEKTHAVVMFLLGDQPLIDASAINDLLFAFRRSNKNICLPVRGQNRGNPTIFSRKFYGAIKHLKGDAGARTIIQSNPTDVHHYITKNPAYFFDIDTETDLNRFNDPDR